MYVIILQLSRLIAHFRISLLLRSPIVGLISGDFGPRLATTLACNIETIPPFPVILSLRPLFRSPPSSYIFPEDSTPMFQGRFRTPLISYYSFIPSYTPSIKQHHLRLSIITFEKTCLSEVAYFLLLVSPTPFSTIRCLHDTIPKSNSKPRAARAKRET